MDVQKVLSTGTAVAVVGTGAVVGGGQVVDNYSGGPEKRANAEEVRLREIIREELYLQLVNAWPTTSGPVKGTPAPKNYKTQIPQK
tara:strand:- start:343 stop:600 length:258 start_codon:yes stop_codon:yes gene_type:complete